MRWNSARQLTRMTPCRRATGCCWPCPSARTGAAAAATPPSSLSGSGHGGHQAAQAHGAAAGAGSSVVVPTAAGGGPGVLVWYAAFHTSFITQEGAATSASTSSAGAGVYRLRLADLDLEHRKRAEPLFPRDTFVDLAFRVDDAAGSSGAAAPSDRRSRDASGAVHSHASASHRKGAADDASHASAAAHSPASPVHIDSSTGRPSLAPALPPGAFSGAGYDASGGILMSGALIKRSALLSKWKRRFFVLRATPPATTPPRPHDTIATLAYFVSERASAPRGVWHLTPALLRRTRAVEARHGTDPHGRSDGKPNVFVVRCPSASASGQGVYLQAASADERDKWLAALHTCRVAAEDGSAAELGHTDDALSDGEAAGADDDDADDEDVGGPEHSAGVLGVGRVDDEDDDD